MSACHRPGRTRVKICGLTREEDALCAAALGVDAVGLVFHPKSARCVTVAQARRVVTALPPFVTVTGLFVDADPAYVRAVCAEVPLALLQFHGSESPEYCAGFGVPYLKAIRMAEGVILQDLGRDYATACGLLLDAWHPTEPGGTGLSFDWTRARQELPQPVVLAGGLNPENVGEAIRACRPFAVDVSSGVEAARGIKDPGKMAAFIREVDRA